MVKCPVRKEAGGRAFNGYAQSSILNRRADGVRTAYLGSVDHGSQDQMLSGLKTEYRSNCLGNCKCDQKRVSGIQANILDFQRKELARWNGRGRDARGVQ